MLTLDSMLEIKKWFERNSEIEFNLPDRHFGRPGDCADIPIKVGIEGKFLIIELAAQYSQSIRKCIFYGEIQYQFVDDCLEISNFDSLIFEWQPYGESGFNTELYEVGKVRFIPHSKYCPKY